MHKSSKITPVCRREIYVLWLKGKKVSVLAREFHVTRRVIYTILKRARLKDFSIHKSTNERFKKAFYGLRRLSKSEKKILGRLAKEANRYEKDYPGEMVHFDSKKLSRIENDDKSLKRESLFVAIDDYSRELFADILPDKSQESSSVFLETVIELAPYEIECAYSDNGTEFKGTEAHDFVWVCDHNGIEQKFTRVGRPQTNGKAERVIRTILEKWLREHTFYSREKRRRSLQQFVRYYNQEKPHSALKLNRVKLTPHQVIRNYVNSKLYTTL